MLWYILILSIHLQKQQTLNQIKTTINEIKFPNFIIFSIFIVYLVYWAQMFYSCFLSSAGVFYCCSTLIKRIFIAVSSHLPLTHHASTHSLSHTGTHTVTKVNREFRCKPLLHLGNVLMFFLLVQSVEHSVIKCLSFCLSVCRIDKSTVSALRARWVRTLTVTFMKYVSRASMLEIVIKSLRIKNQCIIYVNHNDWWCIHTVFNHMMCR